MTQCKRKKCGEYNMLRCARTAGHDGECSFIVEIAHDYPHNRAVSDCRSCLHFSRETDGWERPDIYWYECAKHPGYANLLSFPFKGTKCKSFVRSLKPKE